MILMLFTVSAHADEFATCNYPQLDGSLATLSVRHKGESVTYNNANSGWRNGKSYDVISPEHIDDDLILSMVVKEQQVPLNQVKAFYRFTLEESDDGDLAFYQVESNKGKKASFFVSLGMAGPTPCAPVSGSQKKKKFGGN